MEISVKLAFIIVCFISASCSSTPSFRSGSKDKFRWLEERTSERALNWVENERRIVRSKLIEGQRFKAINKSLLKIGAKSENMPKIQIEGNFAYTIYKANGESRGQWRRVPKQKIGLAIESWEVVIDLDKMSEAKNKELSIPYVDCLKPESRLCLIYLSHAGGDALEIREFDTVKKVFPKDGFRLKKGMSSASWVDQNHISVSSSLGPGNVTKAGYGAELKVLSRGEKLKDSKALLKVPKDYFMPIPYQKNSEGGAVAFASRYHSVNQADEWIFKKRVPIPIDVPNASYVWGVSHNYVILALKEKWQASGRMFKANTIVALNIDSILKNNGASSYDVIKIYEPSKDEFLMKEGMVTKNYIVLNPIQNIRGLIKYVKFDGHKLGAVKSIKVPNENMSLFEVDYWKDEIFFSRESFTSPESVSKCRLKDGKSLNLYSAESQFNTEGIVVEQRYAKSKDGTSIPFYVIGLEKIIAEGNAPTILYGYGGYGISQLPTYDSAYGKHWLEKGGIYVKANIRGGGEFGPEWHKAATKRNKIKSIEDFVAISKSIIKTKLTSPEKLGIYGGSLGGIVVGGAMALSPELYRAVFAFVPEFDPLISFRLGGGSWMGELGDPRIEAERVAILRYSPYQNLKRGVNYPSFLGFSTTTDDRVHPANGRKFAAKLKSFGSEDTLYYEASEGGHGGGKTIEERAILKALQLTFFAEKLGL